VTDWLPWGALLTSTTLSALWALARDGDGEANRKLARRIVTIGGGLTVVCYALYILVGEGWIWY
jgi:hypothetical protein